MRLVSAAKTKSSHGESLSSSVSLVFSSTPRVLDYGDSTKVSAVFGSAPPTLTAGFLRFGVSVHLLLFQIYVQLTLLSFSQLWNSAALSSQLLIAETATL